MPQAAWGRKVSCRRDKLNRPKGEINYSIPARRKQMISNPCRNQTIGFAVRNSAGAAVPAEKIVEQTALALYIMHKLFSYYDNNDPLFCNSGCKIPEKSGNS